MGNKDCKFSDTLRKQIKTDRISDEMKDHIKHCSECSEHYLINSWMTGYSGKKNSKVKLPSFEKIWVGAFREKKVDADLIEKAMFPLKVGRIIAFMVALSAIFLFIVFKNKEIGEMGSRSFDLNFFDSSIIRPFITMFNSSYFISIPLTIILISFMFYFLFSLIKPVSNKNFGNI